MSDGIIGSVGVAVTPDARDFWRRFSMQTSGSAAEAGRRAGADWRRGFDESTRGSDTVRVRADTTEARAQVAALNRQIDQMNRDTSQGGLFAILGGLAPAIAPVVGAATAASAALALMGANGVLAFKGAQAAMQDGTRVGMQYAAGILSIKDSLSQLEQTAARNVLSGFNSSISKLQAGVPQFNIDLKQSSQLLSDIGSHAAGIAAGLLQDLSPAVLVVERDVAALTKQFESFANGPGGKQFGATLAEDFRQVEPLLQNLVELIGHVAAAANGPGLAIIHVLTDITSVLDAIPVGALQPLIAGLSALKIASVVSTYMSRLELSVAGAAVAERDAAIAAERAALAQGDLAAASRAAAAAQVASSEASGIRAFGATAVGVLGKVAAGYLAVRIASDAAAQSTTSWATSTNYAKRLLGMSATAVNDIFSLKFTSILPDLQKDQQAAAQTNAIVSGLAYQWAHYTQVQRVAVRGTNDIVTGTGHLSKALQAQANALGTSAFKLTLGEQLQKSYDQATRSLTDSLHKQAQALHSELGQGSATQLSGAFNATTTAMQKQIDATQKFLGLGGQTVDTYMGVALGSNTYAAALAKTNGNLPRATGLVHAAVDGLVKQKAALATVQAQQARVNKYLSDSIVITTKMSGAQKGATQTGAAATKQLDLTKEQVDAYSYALGINFVRLSKSAYYEQAAETALRKFAGAMVNARSNVQTWITAVSTFEQSSKTAADHAALLGAALVSFNGDAIGYQSAINQTSVASKQFATDLKAVHAGVVDVQTGSIDFHRAGAAPLLSDLASMQQAAQAAAQAMYQHEVSTKGSTQASADAARLYRTETYGALVDEAKRLGLSADAAHHLAQEYFGIPKNVVTRIKQLGADQTNRLLNAIGKQLSYLTGHAWNIGVNVDIHRAATNIGNLVGNLIPGHAAGAKGIPDGLAWVGEGGPGARPELLLKHGPRVDVVSHPKAVAFAKAAGLKVPGFASGTSGSIEALAARYQDWNPHVMAAIAEAESGGRTRAHNYNLSTGDDSYGLWQINMLGSMGPARRREFGIKSDSALFNPSINVMAAHKLWRDAGGSYSPWSTYNSGAYLQFMGQNGKISGGGTGSGGSSSGPKPGSPRYIARHRAAYHNNLVQNRSSAISNVPGDLRSFAHSLSSPQSEKSAFQQLLGDLRGAGVPRSFLTDLRTENAALDKDIRQTTKDVNKLKHDTAALHATVQQRNQERSTIRSAVVGSFDITSAGVNPVTGKVTGGSIEAQAKQEATIIHKWGSDLRKLSREGFGKSPAGRMMLRRLFEQGPSTLPQVEALASESRGELKQLLATETQIMGEGRSLGRFEAHNLYGRRIHDEKQLVHRDRQRVRRDRRRELAEMKEIVREAIHELKRVDLRIDPRGLARAVATGEKQLALSGQRVKK